MATTDWRTTQWKTHSKSHVALWNGDSARIVWSVSPSTDVAYVVPLDGNNGNTNAMLIAMAPDIMRCLLLASTCLRDCQDAAVVKKFVSQAKELLGVDAMHEG